MFAIFRLLGSILFLLICSGCSKEIPTIHALEPLQKDQKLSIAFGSCVNKPKSPVFDSIVAQNPDLMIFLGDNIYLNDHTGLTQMQEVKDELSLRYNRLYDAKGFQNLIGSVPVYAIWDDHDLGPDDSDSLYPFRSETQKAFKKFWGNATSSDIPDSCAFSKIISGVRIILFDERNFRISPNKSTPSSFLGEKQLQWLESQLKNPGSPYVVIASQDQLLASACDRDSFACYGNEQSRLLRILEDSPAHIAIISGDLHNAEILEKKVGKKNLLEVGASPLAAAMHLRTSSTIDPSLKGIYYDTPNFGMLEISPHSDHPFTVRIFSDIGNLALQWIEPKDK